MVTALLLLSESGCLSASIHLWIGSSARAGGPACCLSSRAKVNLVWAGPRWLIERYVLGFNLTTDLLWGIKYFYFCSHPVPRHPTTIIITII